ncbi:hypothetical protein ERO13_D08G118000v2 [Gossypium hirsutum]|uniref:Zinc finger-containing ubiquitin peptidase 1 isoform X3 n=4 Tax=Gossypium TaxID=3633 RepID=A0ABM3AK36_GOSHI|nr:zinc finger-containing ubiquitin peptidase 1 isoform X3 [Gossypium hirsutum]XP_040955058.1 zinc finger-containing ubiquitin peptidase 1 isoform X3 [Gossypium hirsutum]KAB2016979.1 hypothetical protein ES319_D08G128500v1 [Gossypium barbadense]TYG57375.1 hypothetical protein ES288_D08G136300v1 [Gossypium darwinii]TYH58146.1 hypothetical protein ES332_D08G134500v1 [Gossypium tomentosum]KAG4133900.1 hypothetical protein ERO13_D08G118000v2 [Gossypium hirsutum]TYG57377.1 hypothetical protein ES2
MESSVCPFCHLSVPSSELQWHANSHFEDEDKEANDMELGNQIQIASSSGSTDVVSISSLIGLQTRSNFYHVKDGLISLLRNCLELEARHNSSVTILSGYVDHFQSLPSVDVGWGCGWRNIQMLSSHLLAHRKEARKVLFVKQRNAVRVSGPMDKYVHRQQGLIKGRHFCHSLHNGKSDNSKGKSEGPQVLIDWVWNYFSDKGLTISGSSQVVVSDRAPLYFQHDGHSRTIIGIQVKHQKNGTNQFNLLILDPSDGTVALERSLKTNVGWQKLIKRGVHTLKKPQYQLCYIDPGIASGEELNELKTINSIFFEL